MINKLLIGGALTAIAATAVFAQPAPMADKDMTRRLVLCGKQLNLAVYDHIIVGRNAHTSFRELGLI